MKGKDSVNNSILTERANAYWEKRCLINENMIDAVLTLIGYTLPSTRYQIDNLTNQWQDELDRLEIKENSSG